ncbi:Hydrolase (fragment) [Maribacter litoralis]|uniref:Hydrolase n=1 Tax=Maribacter litoralis TaxID=2059726 RepID=A0A653XU75_9FLAO
MDELIDILDANGNLTNRTAMKSEAHKNGWYHQTVHVWFYTLDGR